MIVDNIEKSLLLCEITKILKQITGNDKKHYS